MHTLHVIFSIPQTPSFKKYDFPLPESAGLVSPNGEVPALLQGHTGNTRAQTTQDALIKWMAHEGLGGDLEAATWVLLMIISRT